MKGKEWMKKIEKISTKSLLKYHKALKLLQEWKTFTNEYIGTNIIMMFICDELTKRGKDLGVNYLLERQ